MQSPLRESKKLDKLQENRRLSRWRLKILGVANFLGSRYLPSGYFSSIPDGIELRD